jgi:hypothetical protein
MVRGLALLVITVLLIQGWAAEEIFTLRDGRELTGDYDEVTHVMQVRVGKGHAQLTVRPEDIASRRPAQPEVPVESEERKKIREQAEADQAAIDKRQAEVAAKLADVQAQEQAKARAEEEKRVIDARLTYWRTQGFDIDGRGLTAGEIDGLGQRYQHASDLKQRGFSFDPRTMTIGQMDDAVQAKIDADEIRNAEIARRTEEKAEAEQRARDREAQLRLARIDEEGHNREAEQLAEKERQEIAALQREQDARRAAAVEADRKARWVMIEIVMGALTLWALPVTIAILRRHRNRLAIGVLSAVLLLLVIGEVVAGPAVLPTVATEVQRGVLGAGEIMAWVGALVWSVVRTSRDDRRAVRVDPEPATSSPQDGPY